MDKRAFLRKLAKLKGSFEVDKHGHIRSKEEFSKVSPLFVNHEIKMHMCPLEMVALDEESGRTVPFSFAAEKLKMDSKLACDIVSAADGDFSEDRVIPLRKKMLDILGLKDKVVPKRKKKT